METISTDAEDLPPIYNDRFTACNELLREIEHCHEEMVETQKKRMSCVIEKEEKMLDMAIYKSAENATKKIKTCEKILFSLQNDTSALSASDSKSK